MSDSGERRDEHGRVTPALESVAGGGPHRRAKRAGPGSWSLLGSAAAWLVIVALHRLVGGRWWLWLLPDLIPPLAFVLMPLLLLALAFTPLARTTRRWSALLAVAGLAVGAGIAGVNPRALGFAPAPAAPDAVRIVSWNTGGWSGAHEDPAHFYRFIAAQRADVYLFQEYALYADPRRRDADLALLRDRFPGYDVRITGELLTLSRFPITAVKLLRADPPDDGKWTPGPTIWRDWNAEPDAWRDWNTEYWTVKGMRTDLRVGARTLAVYNVHMPQPFHGLNPFSPSFYRYRRWHLNWRETEYRALESDVAANRFPVVVAGDFNTSPAMSDLRGLSGHLDEATRASRSPYPVSWPSGLLPLWRLDRAFSSPALRVHGYRLHDSHGLSDHRVQDLQVSFRSRR